MTNLKVKIEEILNKQMVYHNITKSEAVKKTTASILDFVKSFILKEIIGGYEVGFPTVELKGRNMEKIEDNGKIYYLLIFDQLRSIVTE